MKCQRCGCEIDAEKQLTTFNDEMEVIHTDLGCIAALRAANTELEQRAGLLDSNQIPGRCVTCRWQTAFRQCVMLGTDITEPATFFCGAHEAEKRS